MCPNPPRHEGLRLHEGGSGVYRQIADDLLAELASVRRVRQANQHDECVEHCVFPLFAEGCILDFPTRHGFRTSWILDPSPAEPPHRRYFINQIGRRNGVVHEDRSAIP
jgi:hypothetical protein